MNLATRALIGAGAAGVVLPLAAESGVSTAATGIVSSILAVFAGVALAAQWMRFQREERRAYRPVYVRSATVHRRVRFDDR